MAVRADNFAGVHYEAVTDSVVVTINYRGTNPNHGFSLKWGSCKERPDGTREIVAEVLDDQAQDAARRNYTTTTSFALGSMACRPATLTLRTAPRFYVSLDIPAGTRRAN